MASLDDYLNQFREVTVHLKLAYVELATLQAAEVRNKADAWRMSVENTVNGRRDFATHMVAETTAEVIELKGDIQAVEAERTWLMVIIDLSAKGFVNS